MDYHLGKEEEQPGVTSFVGNDTDHSIKAYEKAYEERNG